MFKNWIIISLLLFSFSIVKGVELTHLWTSPKKNYEQQNKVGNAGTTSLAFLKEPTSIKVVISATGTAKVDLKVRLIPHKGEPENLTLFRNRTFTRPGKDVGEYAVSIPKALTGKDYKRLIILVQKSEGTLFIKKVSLYKRELAISNQ
jgi:hypothetical protein